MMVEVVLHAGNVRCVLIDRLRYDAKYKWFTVTSGNGSYVRFPLENVHKVEQGAFRSTIYIA